MCHFYGLSLSTLCRLRKMIDHAHLSSGLWTSDHLLLQYIKYKKYNLSWGLQDLEENTRTSMTPSPTSLHSKEKKKRETIKSFSQSEHMHDSMIVMKCIRSEKQTLYVLLGLSALKFLQIAFPSISNLFNSF